ncbi:MAG TPA: FkbM family methyltransferase [Patescibacteria group bacterium]|nr:FkbM family methyltransferase [Patescibacteria group bacterium]
MGVPNIFLRALSPCFVFRPDIFARACWRRLRPRPEKCLARTAWGDLLEIEPRRLIGAHIYMRGVHELAVCEVLWRLAGSGEQVVDVGANIGVMTSMLSRRVGMEGRVVAFEPHPVLYRRLERNVQRWTRPNVLLFNSAVSSQNGHAMLSEHDGFAGNNGIASLSVTNATNTSFGVRTLRLDDALPDGNWAVLKIDVEGHELEVLNGAETFLARTQFRDIIFESDFPSPVHQLLGRNGFSIYELSAGFSGPKLRGARAQGQRADYLATREPARARELIEPSGWNVLRSRVLR